MIDPQIRELADAIRAHPRRTTANYTAGVHLDFEAPADRYPYYHLVPKDPIENAEYRIKLLEAVEADENIADDLWDACSQDILFYVNSFLWTFDPRLVELDENTNIPFLTWNCQDWFFGECVDCLGKYDLNLEKTRDLGASWMVLTTLDWFWRFDDRHLSFLLVSSKEDLVDWRGNPDTLFAKLDHIDKTLPWFLKPKAGINRYNLHRENLDTGSVFTGAATTGDVGRAGRRTAIYMDEFSIFERGDDVAALAATQAATKCRIFTATPKGMGTAHAALRTTPGVKTRQLHWTEHPSHVRGLYRGENGKLDVVDSNYPFPPDYQFKMDGRWRSPFRDEQDRRNQVEWLNDQEYDISYLAESRPFFDGPTLDRLIMSTTAPQFMGKLEYSEESLTPRGLTPIFKGPLRLWMPPERPPFGKQYVIGIDVATGTGGSQASNSVGSVWDIQTGHKVAEYIENRRTPEDFAKDMVALARWFGAGFGRGEGAKLIWEMNGPGGIFGKKVIEFGYTNVYFKRREDDLLKKTSTFPGFQAGRQKTTAFGEYRRALCANEAINPSKDALEEARCYRYANTMASGVEWGGSGTGIDKAETGENHGDRVVADVLGWKLVSESDFKVAKVEWEKPVLQNTLGARQKARREAALTGEEDFY